MDFVKYTCSLLHELFRTCHGIDWNKQWILLCVCHLTKWWALFSYSFANNEYLWVVRKNKRSGSISESKQLESNQWWMIVPQFLSVNDELDRRLIDRRIFFYHRFKKMVFFFSASSRAVINKQNASTQRNVDRHVCACTYVVYVFHTSILVLSNREQTLINNAW